MKRPNIVIFLIVINILAIFSSIARIFDMERRSIMIEFLGPFLGQFDYIMDIFILIFSITLTAGYFYAKKWAWVGTFYFYGLYFIGVIFGYIYGVINIEATMNLASMLKYGELGRLPVGSSAFIIYGGILALFIQVTIAFFILRSLISNKRYFKN